MAPRAGGWAKKSLLAGPVRTAAIEMNLLSREAMAREEVHAPQGA